MIPPKSAFLPLLPALLLLAITPAGLAQFGGSAAETRPNFLIIMADDCTWNDLPLYGGENAKTPHIDALAARGLTFNQAYVASAMCQPCRAELYTGLYPLSNGCAWNHSASRPDTKSLPHFLRPLGYRVGIAGGSFTAVLRGETETHREFAYAMHNNLPEGPRYPIRSITDGTYRYIRNLLPGELYIEKHLMGGGRLNNPYWATWVGDDPVKKPRTYARVKRYMSRPPEQLYHTKSDPYELTNLADQPNHDAARAKLSAALDAWMKAEADPGAAVDTVEALQASRKGAHLHGHR